MKTTRINEIDLLRFLAALSVVFFHYAFWGHAGAAKTVMPYPLLTEFAKYGYLGVELFFMISGFVILMTATNTNLKDFIISRVVRLYPAFWICCTITFIVTILIGAPYITATINQYTVNMTMLSGFVGVPSIDGVYWTLFLEIQFYAFIAVMLLFKRIHQAQTAILLWLLATLALEVHPIDTPCTLLITNYSVFFISGSTFFLIRSKGPSITRFLIIATAYGLAVFQSKNDLKIIEVNCHTGINGNMAIGIITAFFIVMTLISLQYTKFIGRYHFSLIGALTYPIYLLHQNIGYIIFNNLHSKINQHLLFWSTVTATIPAAYVVHHFFEKPLSSKIKIGLNLLLNRLQLRPQPCAEQHDNT